MRSPLLVAQKITVSFGSARNQVQALAGTDLEIFPGESLAIVGESGSGKTTLLRACLGLTAISGGYASLFGKDLSLCSRGELVFLRRRSGYVPQDPFGCVPPTLSALDAVSEPMLIADSPGKKRASERAGELLVECGLADREIWKERVRFSLSGGQRQRVSIARALALDPELLLADEPASMQDAATRKGIMEILRKRCEKGMGLVMATHDLLLASASASRVMVLYRGHVVETGPSKDLLSTPAHPYTRALGAALPGMGHSPQILVRRTDSLSGKTGCVFSARCPRRTEKCSTPPFLIQIGAGRTVACWNPGG
ncbi:MAG TPA: ABC transporter ATP-binding protein [Thermovirgaceae bacterium]|nr:ABC transporter ATP-binding protein [Thermovirgaceae bacterium]